MPSTSQPPEALLSQTEESAHLHPEARETPDTVEAKGGCAFGSREAGWREGCKLKGSSGPVTVVLVMMPRPAGGRGGYT